MDDDLQAVIRADFAAIGSSQWPADELDDIAAWRRAARAVGTELGRPVKTSVGKRVALAYLADWPRDDAERAIRAAQMRRAVEDATLLPSGPPFESESRHCPGCGTELELAGGRSTDTRLHDRCPSCDLTVGAFGT